MTRRVVVPVIAFTVSAISFAGAYWLTTGLERLRVEEKLIFAAPEASLPPEMAIVKVLGSFRGWAINYLWIRAGRLEERGEYQEARGLMGLITTLQPHFERVWGHQSYVMSQSISLACYTKEERWYWIAAAIELLRDEGLKYNPFSLSIYNELARIFTMRIEAGVDRTHWYNKHQIATEWQRLLGTPPAGGGREAMAKWLELIARAPAGDEAELRAALVAGNGGLAVQLRRFERAGGVIDRAFFEAIVAEQTARDADPRAGEASQADAITRWIFEDATDDERTAVVAAARAFLVRHVHRMDPGLMQDLTVLFGPLDWRHPCAHAVYWGAAGVLRKEHRRTDLRIPPVGDSGRAADTSRLYGSITIRQALRFLVQSGRVDVHQGEGHSYFTRLPEPGLADALERAIESLITGQQGRPTATIDEQYRDVLEESAELCFLYGDEAQAQVSLAKLRDRFGRRPSGTPYPESVREMLDLHVVEELERAGIPPGRDRASLTDEEETDRRGVQRGFSEWWVSTRMQSSFEARASGRNEAADRLAEHARTIQEIAAQKGILPLVPRDAFVMSHLGAYLLAPAAVVNPLTKARLWSRLDANRKRGVYAAVRETVESQLEQLGVDPASAFPPPPEK